MLTIISAPALAAGLVDVDYKALVSRSDLVYLRPASQRGHGHPIGNGVMGTQVWTTNDSLEFQINRTDLFAADNQHSGKYGDFRDESGTDICGACARISVGVGGPVEEMTDENWDFVYAVNCKGTFLLIKEVVPVMKRVGGGTIVNVTSVAGRQALLAQSPYVASKWAFEGLSEGLAQELAPFGIRVAIVEPGVTKSAIFAKNVDAPNSTGVYDAHYRRMFQFYAAGRVNATDPFEVARNFRNEGLDATHNPEFTMLEAYET